MSTIETEMIDRYVMGVMKNETMTTTERAQSAAAAIAVHVMTEMGLPMDTALLAEESDLRFLLAEQNDRFADHCDDLADTVDEVYADLGLNVAQNLMEIARQIESMNEVEVKAKQAEEAGFAKGGLFKPSIKPSTMRLVDENFHHSMLDQTVVDHFDQKREPLR